MVQKIGRSIEHIEPGTIPTKRDLFSKIVDNDLIPGIVNRKSPGYQEGDSIYTVAVDRDSAKAAELAISRFMQIKYRGDVEVYDESIVERPWVSNIISFFSYDALYDFMKALIEMNQKDAYGLLSDMLFEFGYSEATGWFEEWSNR